jgi:hypothetical protein
VEPSRIRLFRRKREQAREAGKRACVRRKGLPGWSKGSLPPPGRKEPSPAVPNATVPSVNAERQPSRPEHTARINNLLLELHHRDRLRPMEHEDEPTRRLLMLVEQRRHWVEEKKRYGDRLSAQLKSTSPRC